MMRASFLKLALTALCLSLSLPAAAEPGKHGQQPPAHAQGGKRVKLHEKMRERRAVILRERVGLDEKTALAAEKILDKYQVERQKLEALQREDKKKLRAMLDLDQNDQTAYDKSLQRLLDTQQKLAKLQQQEQGELAKVLTPKQQAKLALAIEEAMRTLRRKLRESRQ
jgi:Spy/CpxP family protein refolding chaperone